MKKLILLSCLPFLLASNNTIARRAGAMLDVEKVVERSIHVASNSDSKGAAPAIQTVRQAIDIHSSIPKIKNDAEEIEVRKKIGVVAKITRAADSITIFSHDTA